MPQKPLRRTLDNLVSSHPSIERLARAAWNDLKEMEAARDKKIRHQKKAITEKEGEIKRLVDSYQTLMDHIFHPSAVTLLDCDEKTRFQVPLSKACEFSPLLATAFTGAMQEAQTKLYKTKFEKSTLQVLAKAIVCDNKLWKSTGVLQDCDANTLVLTMEACDFLGAFALFQAALCQFSQACVGSMTVETAFMVMKNSTTSGWRERWRSLEDAAAMVIAESVTTHGAASLHSSFLKELSSGQLAKVIASVRTVSESENDMFGASRWESATIHWQGQPQNHVTAEAALLRADSQGVYVQIPVRMADIPIDTDLSLKLKYRFQATLKVENWQLDSDSDSDSDSDYFRLKEHAWHFASDSETPTVIRTIKMKLGDESFRLYLVKLRLNPSHGNVLAPSLANVASLVLEWKAVPSPLHVQCDLLLQSRDATLADLGHLLGSTEESDRCSAQILLDYTSECFSQLRKSPALLAWPAEAVRRLVQQLGPDEAGSEPRVLRFLLAWVAKHGADARQPGCELLDELVASGDLGWARALSDDGGLEPAEKKLIMGSGRFAEVLRAALTSHYTPRQSERSAHCSRGLAACSSSTDSASLPTKRSRCYWDESSSGSDEFQ